MFEISERKQRILRAIVVEYVSTAEPIASDRLVEKYELGVKSATVRNEMAEITELGFLEQPHTSAGRIPSDFGYRFYVDRLIETPTVEVGEGAKIKSAASDEETLRDLVAETAKTLSRLTRSMSAATTVRDANLVLKQVVLTAVGPEKGLLICVFANGHVENRLVDLPLGFTLEELSPLNELVNYRFAGQTLQALGTATSPLVGIPHRDVALQSILTSIQSIAGELMKGHLILEGQNYIFAEPEFSRNPDAIQSLVAGIENDANLIEAIEQNPGNSSTVTIGRENVQGEYQSLSVMRQKFRIGDEEAGTIALIGPTRMNYDRNWSYLSFSADAISTTLSKLYS